MAKRKLGIDTLSLSLAIIGLIWNNISATDNLISFMGLRTWSGGNPNVHYTAYYALIFYLPAFLLGMKYKNDFGAYVGRVISGLMGLGLILAALLLLVM